MLPAQASGGAVLETLPGEAQTPMATLTPHSWGPGLLLTAPCRPLPGPIMGGRTEAEAPPAGPQLRPWACEGRRGAGPGPSLAWCHFDDTGGAGPGPGACLCLERGHPCSCHTGDRAPGMAQWVRWGDGSCSPGLRRGGQGQRGGRRTFPVPRP